MHRTNEPSLDAKKLEFQAERARRRPSNAVCAQLAARCSRLVPTEKTVRCRMIRTCLFQPRILPEREGVLQEFTAGLSPPWAPAGIDIKNATGWCWHATHPIRGY